MADASQESDAERTEAADLPAEQAFTVLKALSHPVRGRILRALAARSPMRVSDVAAEVHEPPNSVSYHLRQLAHAGIIERVTPDDASHDGRESWWRIPRERRTMRVDTARVRSLPGGPQALSAFDDLTQRESSALFSPEARDTAEATGWPLLTADVVLRLSRDEARAFLDGVQRLLDNARALARAHQTADDPGTFRYAVRAAALPSGPGDGSGPVSVISRSDGDEGEPDADGPDRPGRDSRSS